MRPHTRGEVLAAVSLLETIQRTYWSGEGADEMAVDLLANLRHFCDAHNLKFPELQQRAYGHYVDEFGLPPPAFLYEPPTPTIEYTAPMEMDVDLSHPEPCGFVEGSIKIEDVAYRVKIRCGARELPNFHVLTSILRSVVRIARALIGARLPLSNIEFRCGAGYSIELVQSAR